MLTCYGHRIRLPQNNLAYLAFRLALQETLSDIELYLDLDEEPDPPAGFLTCVPFLQHVPLQVQLDLLANTWARHNRSELCEANLLEAAVVFAACVAAGELVDDMPDVAVAMLQGGPRKLGSKILRRASARLDQMFEEFWDDQDFLLIDDLQDLPPDHAQVLKEVLNLPDEWLEPLYEALQRWRVSPRLTANLEGLMTDAEIEELMPLLNAWMTRQEPREADTENDQDNEAPFLHGLEDRFHSLLVGPCEPDTATAEADCPLVAEMLAAEECFDCTYEQWVAHFRGEVRKAAETAERQLPEAEDDPPDLARLVRQAQTSGLDDGTRIELRDNGWVVVDGNDFVLDPEDVSWIAGEDGDDLPPTVYFPTAEAAFRAWVLAERETKERIRRREEALRRLEGME